MNSSHWVSDNQPFYNNGVKYVSNPYFSGSPVEFDRAVGAFFAGPAIIPVAVDAGAAIVVTAKLLAQAKRSDIIRWGETVVSNQILEEPRATGASVRWTVKGGGGPFSWKYHIGFYNWFKPWTWFTQTPIIKP